MVRARYGDTEWDEALDRFIDWATFLQVSPRRAFELAAKLFKEEHHGVCHCVIDHWEDYEWQEDTPPEMQYLNMGDTYATTLILTDDYVNGVKLLKSCWGDWYEKMELHHDLELKFRSCGYCGHRVCIADLEDPSQSEHVMCSCGHMLDGQKPKQIYRVEDWNGNEPFRIRFGDFTTASSFVLTKYATDEDLEDAYIVQ